MGLPPSAAMMLPALLQKFGGGGQPTPPTGTPGASPGQAGQQLSQQYSQLQGADPQKLLADLKKGKEQLAAMFPIAVTRVPDAAKGISQAVTGINAAIKALEKAQQAMSAVAPALGISAASPNPNSPNPLGGM